LDCKIFVFLNKVIVRIQTTTELGDDNEINNVQVIESLGSKGVVTRWYSPENLDKGGYKIYHPIRTSDNNYKSAILGVILGFNMGDYFQENKDQEIVK